MPEYRHQGYAQEALKALELMYGSSHWSLDTILQEKGNLYLYGKMGYQQVGKLIS